MSGTKLGAMNPTVLAISYGGVSLAIAGMAGVEHSHANEDLAVFSGAALLAALVVVLWHRRRGRRG